ncbi:hypothetical protein PCL_00891 [Purpureocillium lilacinum]|uniref:Uncharacterized protein n=1 Tax=Purpureocillium lilacinum TaxID=33203 RepID=A0A2U3E448_PURLI|nr:hypothetical protein PCL_00891 [Purpureocillium lilacinum]
MVKNGWLQRSGQSSWGGIMGVGRSGCSVAHGHRTDRGPRRGGGKAADCAEEEEEEEEEARGVGRVQAQGNGDARRTRKKGPVCWMGEGDGVVWVRVASLTTGGTGAPKGSAPHHTIRRSPGFRWIVRDGLGQCAARNASVEDQSRTSPRAGGGTHPEGRLAQATALQRILGGFQVGSIRWGVGKVCVQDTRPDYCTSSLAAQVTEVVCTAGFGPERRVPEPQLHSALARNLLGFADRNPGPVPQRCSRPRYFPKPSAPWEMQRRGSWAAERGCKHRVLARTLGGAEALRPDAAAGWVVQPGTHARRAARIRQPGGRATGHLYGWVRARCPGRALTGSHPSQAPIRHPPHPTSRLQ